MSLRFTFSVQSLRFKVVGLLLALVCALLAGCKTAPQKGGHSATTLGGTTTPTASTLAAPENPQTETEQVLEKDTVREYLPEPEKLSVHSSAVHGSQSDNREPKAEDFSASPTAPKSLIRERVVERATTRLGTAQKDTARELSTRLANMRGVMWVGVLLLIGGPIIGWKLGWFTNGCLAGGVGLLLIILSAVIPGNEAWLGLGGLLLLPLVAYVYYKAHHDAASSELRMPGDFTRGGYTGPRNDQRPSNGK